MIQNKKKQIFRDINLGNPQKMPSPKNSDDEDDICTICYTINNSKLAFYNCTKRHNICFQCYENHTNFVTNIMRNNTCPTCAADLKNEYKDPYLLTPIELSDLNIKNILKNNIHIHQHFKLQKNTHIIKLSSNKTEIFFHALNGKMLTYLDMFVCQNGFLYTYDTKCEIYHVAVSRNKFQFWDINKMILNL